MKIKAKTIFLIGLLFVIIFLIWTWLIQVVDVNSIGPNCTDVGFATFNSWFHKITGVNMTLYSITDWLGLVPIFICIVFGCIGLVQLVKRKSLLQVDFDIILLGLYYVVVIFGYLIFEMIPINYRPVLINGNLEASYPSSTTLLVLSVMPTLVFQANRKMKNAGMKTCISVLSVFFSLFMVIGRLVSGVHWFTDIVGSILLSTGLFCIYKGLALLSDKKE
jgi:undecaprenyl-diphosphatase